MDVGAVFVVGADDVEAGAAVAFGGGLVLDDVFPDFDVVFVDVGHRLFLIGRGCSRERLHLF